jgi:2-keto-4-pentenoate hydratase/2-oxohepta-3-ene-1,7-dioic acid hydratase in catechol pathway
MTTSHRYARLALEDGRSMFVELEGGHAHALSAAPWLGGTRTGKILEGFDDQGRGPADRLAPVEPRKILCVGRNYRAHAKELGNEVPVEPMLFMKPTTSLLEPGGAIELPPESISAKVEHEAELAIVVGKSLKHASLDHAAAAIFGVTIACDVTARDLQKKDGQWWRAKGMDTFCPVGPVVVTGLDPQALDIECRVSGELRQQGSTGDMIFSVAQVLVHVSRVMTLEPGDLILTGTPEGVGPLTPGDTLTISISQVGTLDCRVEAAPSA